MARLGAALPLACRIHCRWFLTRQFARVVWLFLPRQKIYRCNWIAIDELEIPVTEHRRGLPIHKREIVVANSTSRLAGDRANSKQLGWALGMGNQCEFPPDEPAEGSVADTLSGCGGIRSLPPARVGKRPSEEDACGEFPRNPDG